MCKTLKLAFLSFIIMLLLLTSLSINSFAAKEVKDITVTSGQMALSNISFAGVKQKSTFSFTLRSVGFAEDADTTGFNVFFQSGQAKAYAIASPKMTLYDGKLTVVNNATFKDVPKAGDKIIFKNADFNITYTLSASDKFSTIPAIPKVTVKGSGKDTIFSVSGEIGGIITFTSGSSNKSFDMTAAKQTVNMSSLPDDLISFAITNGYINVYYSNLTKYGEGVSQTVPVNISKGTQSPVPSVTVNYKDSTFTVKAKDLDSTWEIIAYKGAYTKNGITATSPKTIAADAITISKPGSAVIKFSGVFSGSDNNNYHNVIFTVKKPDTFVSPMSSMVEVKYFTSADDQLRIWCVPSFTTKDQIVFSAYAIPANQKLLVFAVPKGESALVKDTEFDASGKYEDAVLKKAVASPYYTGMSVKISPFKDTVIKTDLKQYYGYDLMIYAVSTDSSAEKKGEFLKTSGSYFTISTSDYASYKFNASMQINIFNGKIGRNIVVSEVNKGDKITISNSKTGASKTITAPDSVAVFTNLKYALEYDSISITSPNSPITKRVDLVEGYYVWNDNIVTYKTLAEYNR